MTLNQKRLVIIGLAFLFLASLVLVQWREVARKQEELGIAPAHVAVPATSKACVDCHGQTTPAIIDHWKGSKHAVSGVACYDCHKADKADADAFEHYGASVAVIVTPRDCSRCHTEVAQEFQRSHHAAAGNILASLDNFLAETVEGGPSVFNPHSPTPGKAVEAVMGKSSAFSGCQQCHGSKVALQSTDGGIITVDDLSPDENGQPTNTDVLGRILKDQNGRPKLSSTTWPNTGIGRLNLDGSRGSCSACHSRHDFSPRRARQPENCGKCHLGPDHPQ
ncbi:MAG: hydroxylamine oxidoreductase, partial [Acidobacteria bacterium]|nr:hydroxylamine oxidoreductase [Acidobacteriota bacterium]